MPVGMQRLNVPQSHHPNDRIVFIKPLAGPDSTTANDFLSRIAAICLPIMRTHHLSVMTLEEHEPNPEFIGRNFNAGEIIQLVLKSKSGRWLPFRMVQMVMMHELAHCVQMNHSREFWKVRNGYSEDLRGLWGKGFVGEGMWGRGRELYTGQYANNDNPGEEDDVPEHLCGGTFRSRRRGRKRKRAGDGQNLSYAERKQRRIEKKFGKNGEALGGNELLRGALERKKQVAGKPRVAGSKRGRDLRAAAALLRFEKDKNEKASEQQQAQKGVQEIKREEDSEDTDSETDTEAVYGAQRGAVDTDGSFLKDSKGRSMIKVCGDEDIHDDASARREMEELGRMSGGLASSGARPTSRTRDDTSERRQNHAGHSTVDDTPIKDEPQDDDSSANRYDVPIKAEPEDSVPWLPDSPFQNANATHSEIPNQTLEKSLSVPHNGSTRSGATNAPRRKLPWLSNNTISPPDIRPIKLDPPPPATSATLDTPQEPSVSSTADVSDPSSQNCPICSLANNNDALICVACAHVLDTQRMPRFWKCASDGCKALGYMNCDDVGRCGICDSAKPTSA
ncbi:MAG: hypothetical protein M1831_006553 [Alyxoria varia]|nr:MAG: hypothetical protein M1831_006553 [Alyxoria varia]